MKSKKLLFSTIFAVVFLIVLVFSATYAYFTVEVAKNFGTVSINASAPTVGTVTLRAGNNLTMNLTVAQMADMGIDTTYYASANGATTTVTSPAIATASVDSEGTYSCNYTISVAASATKSMYTAFQEMASKSTGQIVLTVGSNTYDFNTAGLFPITVTGTLSGITSTSAKTLTAQLKFVNKTGVVQNALAGTDITLKFTPTAFDCTTTA